MLSSRNAWRGSVAGLCLLAAPACAQRGDSSDSAGADSAAVDTAAHAEAQVITPPTAVFDSTVDWARIQELLRFETSKVSMVTEGRARQVSVRMKDGRLYRAVEPSPAAIIRLAQEIDKTGSIMVVAE